MYTHTHTHIFIWLNEYIHADASDVNVLVEMKDFNLISYIVWYTRLPVVF